RTMFGDRKTRAGNDERGRGRNVESLYCARSRPSRIDEASVARRQRHRACAHCGSHARQLLHRLTFYSHGSKCGRDLRVGRVRMEKRVQEFSRFLSSKMLAPHQARGYLAQCQIADYLLEVHLVK